MSDSPPNMARPASVADLKLLLGALQLHGVDYLIISKALIFACTCSMIAAQTAAFFFAFRIFRSSD